MLKSIRLSNFKSIADKPVLLGNLNVLIGANAAGKSNFVDALRFIHDILTDGLSSAVGRRTGWENVLTREKESTEKITIEISYDLKDMDHEIKIKKKTYEAVNFSYKLEASYTKKRLHFNSESLRARFEHDGDEITEKFVRSRKKVTVHSPLSLEEQTKSLDIPKQFEDKLFLQGGFFCIGSLLLSTFIEGWRFYDFDVNVARHPCIDETQTILLDDGHNLAFILDRLRAASSHTVRERILRIMSILVPGFEGWKTARQFDGSLGFKVHEKGIKKDLLPKMVSDGTIRLLSMLLALLYQPPQTALICVDEPERYLHPQVLGTLVEIMRDVSKKTQLIVTTHSTDLVKCLKPSELFMVDKINNVTHIVRAQDVSMVDKFLEQFSLEELWLGGHLKGGKVL